MKPIKLSGDCSIYEISSLHEKVMKAWKGESPLALDLAKVTEMDPSFIQLLISCKQTAENKEQSLELLNAPEELTHMIDAMFTSDIFSAEPGLEDPAPTGA
jgi:ABC-type transporter Mla MlaB component